MAYFSLDSDNLSTKTNLAECANRDVKLDIRFYDDDPNVPEYFSRFEKLEKELGAEDFGIANLSVSEVEQEYLEDDFLVLSNKQKQAREIRAYRFESD